MPGASVESIHGLSKLHRRAFLRDSLFPVPDGGVLLGWFQFCVTQFLADYYFRQGMEIKITNRRATTSA